MLERKEGSFYLIVRMEKLNKRFPGISSIQTDTKLCNSLTNWSNLKLYRTNQSVELESGLGIEQEMLILVRLSYP